MKVPSAKQCRISSSADRWEYLVVCLVIIKDFLTVKQVYKVHGYALQVFISVFPVLNRTFQDPCFSHMDLSGLSGFMGFLWRQTLIMLYAVQTDKTHLFIRQWVQLWGQRHSVGAAGPVNHLQDLALQDRPFNKEGTTLFWKWLVD